MVGAPPLSLFPTDWTTMQTKYRSRLRKARWSARGGFTLIELLIVMLVIGILATIVVARYHMVRDRAWQTVLTADFHSLVKQQELYYAVNDTYGELEDLNSYSSSDGTAIEINYATENGWSATATHASAADYSCGIVVGNAPSMGGFPQNVPICSEDE